MDTGTDHFQMPTSRPRPLPTPPASTQPPTTPKHSSPSPSPPLSPVPAYSPLPHKIIPMQNKLSAAQQLYASSFTTRTPSVPSLPPPSIRGQPINSDRQSLYKNHVASYVQSPPSTLRPRSPASLSSALNSHMIPSPSYSSTFEPQSPPYSAHSLSDEGLNPSTTNVRPRVYSTSRPQGRPEPDPYARTTITTQINRTNPIAPYAHHQPSRNLFDMKYVDTAHSKPRAVRTVSTLAKPPPNAMGLGVPQATSLTLSQTSLHPGSPPLGVVLGATAIASGMANSLPMPPAPPVTAIPSNTQQSTTSNHPHHHAVRPQGLVPPHSSPVQQQQYPPQQPQPQPQPPRPPQTAQTSPNPHPPKPAKPNKQSNGFMTNLGSSFASSFGKTAGQISAQALLSSLGVEEEDEGGGILDAVGSGFAGLNMGDNGAGDAGGSGEPAPTCEPATPAGGGEYLTDPGAYYAAPQDSGTATAYPLQPTGAEYQNIFSAQAQYNTSYTVELPTIEFSHHSGGGGHHGGNLSGHTQATTQYNSYPNQGSLPTGAQRPYRPHQPIHTVPHQPQSPGWSPYQ